MSALSAAASDEDGDTISTLRAENEMLRQSLLTANDTLQKVARAGACHAQAAECLRETVIRWANRAEQAEDMLEAIGAGGVGKLGQQQAVQDPVEYWTVANGWVSEQAEVPAAAWVYPEFWDHCKNVGCGTAYRQPGSGRQPLYTCPQPKREPLTAEQIADIEDMFSNEFGLEAKHAVDFARAIERAHGIGGDA